MDCSLGGFSVHEISQTRILEWVAISSSRGSSQPRNWTCISCTTGRFFSTAPPGKPPVAVVLMVFPVVMYRCQRWTIKMAENQRIDACELWGWRRLLRVSWFGRKSNLSVLTEIHPEYSLHLPDAEAEAPLLWPPDSKSQLTRRDPDAEKDWKQEGKWVTEDVMVGWHHWLNWHDLKQTPGDGEGRGRPEDYSP